MRLHIFLNFNCIVLFSNILYVFVSMKSQGTHDHEHGQEKHGGENVSLLEEFDAVWKSLTALAGIYLLFIIEHCLGMFKHYKDQGVRKALQTQKHTSFHFIYCLFGRDSAQYTIHNIIKKSIN